MLGLVFLVVQWWAAITDDFDVVIDLFRVIYRGGWVNWVLTFTVHHEMGFTRGPLGDGDGDNTGGENWGIWRRKQEYGNRKIQMPSFLLHRANSTADRDMMSVSGSEQRITSQAPKHGLRHISPTWVHRWLWWGRACSKWRCSWWCSRNNMRIWWSSWWIAWRHKTDI